jgi:peptidoglycan/xylan/chitin deacetylase (PgdA/CDA1 family)
MKKNFLNKAMSYVLPLAVTLGTVQVPVHAMAQRQVERPPQYVLLAFDGSYRDSIWKYLRKFSKDHAQENTDVRFTFFISSVYLMERAAGLQYYHPAGGHKGSAIGWGDDRADINNRIDNINGAFEEGHEIGSHAAGHWDGSKWTAQDWKNEFNAFYGMIDGVFAFNKLPPRPLKFRKSILGFRAPLLGYSKGMYQELPEFGMLYDTSQQSETMDYWPQQGNWQVKSSIWNFPLGKVAIPGTAKHYPTMDYNFCANDSIEILRKYPELTRYSGIDAATGRKTSNFIGVDKKTGQDIHIDCMRVVPPNVKKFIEDRTYQAYMNYFNNNYYGNRAPISIGHHFSKWMSGAYFDAMMHVAETVCSKPEVKCVTYTELMKFMNAKTASGEAASFKKANFPLMPRPKAILQPVALDINADMVKDGDSLKLVLSGRDAKMKGLKTEFFVNGKSIEGNSITLNELRGYAPVGSKLEVGGVVLNRQGNEIQSATHIIENLGTREEAFHTESLESTFAKGDLPGAHADEGGGADAQGN